MEPHNTHDNPDFLTIEHLEKSARVENMSLDEAVQNLVQTVQVAKQETQHQHR